MVIGWTRRASAFGLSWSYGRLISTLAGSGLLPIAVRSFVPDNTQLVCLSSCKSSLLVGLTATFFTCLVSHYSRIIHINILVNSSSALLFISHVGQCLTYIKLRSVLHGSLSSLPVWTRNPFGSIGILASLAVWLLALFGLLAFQSSGGREAAIFLSVIAILSSYYHLYAKSKQIFSVEERELLSVLLSATRHFQVKPSPVGHRTTTTTVSTSPPDSFVGSVPIAPAPGNAEIQSASQLAAHFNAIAEMYDDLDVPYIPVLPPSTSSSPTVNSIITTASGSQASLRRAGSDSLITNNPRPAPVVPRTLASLGIDPSHHFFNRHRRLERLREETERDLRSAMSGVWSDRSRKFSHGMGG